MKFQLSPIALAVALVPSFVFAQPAGNTTSADTKDGSSQFLAGGQADISPRPYNSMMDRISSTVQKIQFESYADNIQADGVQINEIKGNLLDRQGNLVRGEQTITIEASGGARVTLPNRMTAETGADLADIDKVTPGTQVKVVDGRFSFKLRAPYQAELITVRVSLRGIEEQLQIRYVPDLREMLAVGVLEARLRSDKFDPRALVAARENDGFEQELKHLSKEFNGGSGHVGARLAMYLKGKVAGDYLLTLAYDSDKDTRKQLFETIDPNAFYPVYGDSSLRVQDAQSRGKLYLRLDKGRTYLLWGDYTTVDNNPARRLSQYNRSLPGLKAHIEEGGLTVNAYAAQENFKQIVDEFPARGVSGPYTVSNPNGIKGTERIEIIVRDRIQTANILKSTALVRSADYEFEPFSGQILFRSPIPSVDDQLNPVSIRITYEVEQGGEKYFVYGADARLKITDSITLGASINKDRNPVAPQTQAGVNIALKLSKNTEFIAEFAKSTTVVNADANGYSANNSANFLGKTGEFNGNAMRAELRHTDENLRANAFVIKTDNDFNNASSGLTGGKQQAGLAAIYKPADALTVSGDLKLDKDKIVGSENKAASVAADLKVTNQLSIGIGARRVEQNSLSLTQQAINNCVTNGNGITGVSNTVYAGSIPGYNSGYGISQVGNQSIDPATGLPVVCNTSVNQVAATPPDISRTAGFIRANLQLNNQVGLNAELQNITGTDPVRTASLGLRYKPNEDFSLNGQYQKEIGGTNANLYRLGADWRVADKTRLYTRYEYAHTYGGAYGMGLGPLNKTFALGVDTQYMQNGSLYSEYRLMDSVSGQSVQNAIGLRNGWVISEGLRLQTNAERLIGTNTQSTALGLGVEYLPSSLWKSSGRINWRQDQDYVNWLMTAGVAVKLNRNFTAMVREYYNRIDPRNGSQETKQNRMQLGVAYRPVDNNRFDALGLYENKYEVSPSADRHVNILSVRANYHPARPWWFSGRVAYKSVNELLSGNVRDSYHASLIGGRVTYDITNRWSIGALTTQMVGQGGSRQYAYGLEVGYTLMDNMIVGVGYNWRGFSDKDLTNYDYTNRGWVLNMRYKFDEDLFKSNDASANRTLDPKGAPSLGTGAGIPLPNLKP